MKTTDSALYAGVVSVLRKTVIVINGVEIVTSQCNYTVSIDEADMIKDNQDIIDWLETK